MQLSSPICPVCNASGARLLWKENLPQQIETKEYSYSGTKNLHGRIHRCQSCGHGFTHPIPHFEESPYCDVVDDFYLATEAERRKTFEDYLDIKEQYAPERGTLLDVGCYAGTFLELAQNRGYTASGIELSHWGCAHTAARGLPVQRMGVEGLDATHSFDCITAFDVIEHISNPQEAVSKIYEALNPGGVFALSVPDMGTWHARLLGKRHWLVILMHYQYFIRRSLHRLLSNAGFDKIEILTAPPSRIRLADAGNHGKTVPLLGTILRAGSQLPLINNLELKLHASLFGLAWKK